MKLKNKMHNILCYLCLKYSPTNPFGSIWNLHIFRDKEKRHDVL